MKRYTEEEMREAIKAVAAEQKTGRQTRADIQQTLEVIGEIVEDRYLTKEDLEPVQQCLHTLEDYLDITGSFRRNAERIDYELDY